MTAAVSAAHPECPWLSRLSVAHRPRAEPLISADLVELIHNLRKGNNLLIGTVGELHYITQESQLKITVKRN